MICELGLWARSFRFASDASMPQWVYHFFDARIQLELNRSRLANVSIDEKTFVHTCNYRTH